MKKYLPVLRTCTLFQGLSDNALIIQEDVWGNRNVITRLRPRDFFAESFALEKARQLGCKAVRLDTREENHPAASLYESMGFCLAGSAPMCLHGGFRNSRYF